MCNTLSHEIYNCVIFKKSYPLKLEEELVLENCPLLLGLKIEFCPIQKLMKYNHMIFSYWWHFGDTCITKLNTCYMHCIIKALASHGKYLCLYTSYLKLGTSLWYLQIEAVSIKLYMFKGRGPGINSSQSKNVGKIQLSMQLSHLSIIFENI